MILRLLPPALALFALLVPSRVATQQVETWTPETHLRFGVVTETALSPDGELVAYTVRRAGPSDGPSDAPAQRQFRTRVWLAKTDGSWSGPLTSADHSSRAPAFSSDGTHVAFLSDRVRGTQVWIRELAGGPSIRATDAPLGVSGFAWSPAPERLAFRGPDPRSPHENTHVFVANVLTPEGAVHDSVPEAVQVTWGAYHVRDFDWSPESDWIVASVAPNSSPDAAMRGSSLIVAHLNGRGVRRRYQRTDVGGTESGARWSPDGAWIAFNGSGEEAAPWGLGDIYVMPAEGGEPRRLATTGERSGSAPLGWSGASDAILVAEARGTSIDLFSVPLDGSVPERITKAEAHRQAFSVAPAAGLVAFAEESTGRPPEVIVLDLATGARVAVSSVNRRIEAPTMAPTAPVRWRGDAGTEVEGLLTESPSLDGRPGTLAVVLHGGPAASWTRTFTGRPETYMVQALAAKGFAVLRPNPRGSLGYGAEYRSAVRGDWLGADLGDVMGGVDAMIDRGVAHPDSVVVVGWGYGGYLAAALTARSDRFRAGSVGSPLMGLAGLALTTDIPAYLASHMGGEVWERPEAYHRASLTSRLGELDTPLQVVRGAPGDRIPQGQAHALWRGLAQRGVPTELVTIEGTTPEESPEALLQMHGSMVAWLDAHMRPTSGPPVVDRPSARARQTSFVASEYAPYLKVGAGSIDGVAYLVMPNGSRVFCSNELVFMNPVTTLSTEWYERNVLAREELEPLPLSSAPQRAHWITRADEQGRFRFVDLPAGEYYLGCRALEDQGFAHGRVTLTEGEASTVLLTRNVPPGGDDPLDEVPTLAEEPSPKITGPGEWGQLEGTWQCRVLTPTPDGSVVETRSTWSWEYILGGLGVRDEYVGLADDGSVRFRGTAIRVYDAETGAWHVTWADDASPGTREYTATYEAGRMTMSKAGDPDWRTVFYDITRTTFDWFTEPQPSRMRCVREG